MQAKDFSVGDRVRHSNGDQGTVIAAVNGVITIQFSRMSADKGEVTWLGKYDAQWFAMHANALSILK